MSAASFRFHGELECFVARERRGDVSRNEYARAATLKQAIESLGVPHTEIGHVTVSSRAPERIRVRYDRFMHCCGCDRVYWEGSHWERMRSVLAETLDVPLADMR